MLPAGREAGLDVGARVYVRHRSERTLLPAQTLEQIGQERKVQAQLAHGSKVRQGRTPGTVAHDPALIHQHDAIGQGDRLLHAMFDQHHGQRSR